MTFNNSMECLLCKDKHEIKHGVLLVTDSLYHMTFSDRHLISTQNLRFHLAVAMIDGADLQDMVEYIHLAGNSVAMDVLEEVGTIRVTQMDIFQICSCTSTYIV